MVRIDNDVFIDMLWDRVSEFDPARKYDDNFWEDIFKYLESTNWTGNPNTNSPKYIIDNIAVNGQFVTAEELKSNFDTIPDIQKEEPNKYFLKFGDKYCIHLGLN